MPNSREARTRKTSLRRANCQKTFQAHMPTRTIEWLGRLEWLEWLLMDEPPIFKVAWDFEDCFDTTHSVHSQDTSPHNRGQCHGRPQAEGFCGVHWAPRQSTFFTQCFLLSSSHVSLVVACNCVAVLSCCGAAQGKHGRLLLASMLWWLSIGFPDMLHVFVMSF